MTTISRSPLSSHGVLSRAASLVARLLGHAARVTDATSRPAAPRLLLGPVGRQSASPHPAPARLAVPQGAALSFECCWDEPHDVDWSGVRPVTRDTAEVELARPGRRRIEVTVCSRDGRRVYAWTVEVDVLPRAGCAAA